MDILELARILYNAVGKATDFRSPLGDPLPRWDVLPEPMKQAWAAGAQAVLNANNTPLAVPAGAESDVLPFQGDEDRHYVSLGDTWTKRGL